ncbi:hypothetical protein THOM_2349, partial [Trachipleistophora hominis]
VKKCEVLIKRTLKQKNDYLGPVAIVGLETRNVCLIR